MKLGDGLLDERDPHLPRKASAESKLAFASVVPPPHCREGVVQEDNHPLSVKAEPHLVVVVVVQQQAVARFGQVRGAGTKARDRGGEAGVRHRQCQFAVLRERATLMDSFSPG
jgi:hypothetical protein